MTDDADWPALPLEAWEPTWATLQMWCQVVGKVRDRAELERPEI